MLSVSTQTDRRYGQPAACPYAMQFMDKAGRKLYPMGLVAHLSSGETTAHFPTPVAVTYTHSTLILRGQHY
jgi:hypothetical protein